MDVVIEWRELVDRDEGWQADCTLYAHCTVDGSEILYIGKADGTTVRRRWNCPDKEGFWGDLERERGIYEHAVFLGEIGLTPGRRLTREPLSDIESLLIRRLRPGGNIQCQNSRISRPGLRVICAGDSPAAQSKFRDI